MGSEDVDDDIGPGRCDMCGDRLDESQFTYWTENGEVCDFCYHDMICDDDERAEVGG